MERCTKCPSVLMQHEEVMCSRCRDKEDARAADLRELHRAAALAALSGMPRVGMESSININGLVKEAIMYADEFVRQYNPDAVIAEVVG